MAVVFNYEFIQFLLAVFKWAIGWKNDKMCIIFFEKMYELNSRSIKSCVLFDDFLLHALNETKYKWKMINPAYFYQIGVVHFYNAM